MMRALAACALLALTLFTAPQRAAAFATFEIMVADDPGEGFNDPTPATPVGGNTGTTLGAQRLQALQYAADQWGAQLDSTVVIKIAATFDPIECVGGYSTTLALGGTTFLEFVFDDEGDEVIVPTALGDRMEGMDLTPDQADISIQFNSNVDSRTCIEGIGWYYGLDGSPGTDTDMIDTALHEIAHGLGIQSLHDQDTGELINNTPPAYLKRVLDLDTDKHWSEMTTAERLLSQGNARRVVWDGPRTTALSSELLASGLPSVTSPQVPSLSGFYADTTFGAWTVATSVSGELAADTTGNCPPSNVSGKVALLAWECAHSSWAVSIQSDGAIAILIESAADWEVPAVPYDEPMPLPIGVPVIAVSSADYLKLIDAATAGTVTVELAIDEDARLGADDEGRVMMNISTPVNLSSLAHVEPLARPNLLMEPLTTPRTLHELDITPAMLHDIGWVPFCGNGELDQEEECDDAEDNDDEKPNACRTTCVKAACGDGVLDSGEACDDGDDNSPTAPNACRTTCEEPACGDGVRDDGEACDEGAENDDVAPNACRTSCEEASCGDGVTDQGETCDDGANNSDTMAGACRTACVVARCGDGVLDSGEACDDGAANDDRKPNACRASCEEASCGDGVVDDGELCDPETGMPCNTDCTSEDPAAPPLGDGGVRDGDEADAQIAAEDDGGCGCRTVGASPTSNSTGALLFALGTLALFMRRSRRTRRH